jgi:hypothetical protein
MDGIGSTRSAAFGTHDCRNLPDAHSDCVCGEKPVELARYAGNAVRRRPHRPGHAKAGDS